jgi:hypothetical protein
MVVVLAVGLAFAWPWLRVSAVDAGAADRYAPIRARAEALHGRPQGAE